MKQTFTKEQIKHFQELLTSERVQLESELAGLGRKIDGSSDWMATPNEHDGGESDPNDQADAVEEYESKVGRLGALEIRYQEILRAQERFEKGTYGICVKSGQPIELDRLEANPAAETSKAMMNSR